MRSLLWDLPENLHENLMRKLWDLFDEDPLLRVGCKYQTWDTANIKHFKTLDWMLQSFIHNQTRVATGQGKVREIWFFFQGQGKVREFCKLVREILNTKKVREKSGNFKILVQNMCCSGYFDYLKCEKSVNFFSRSLRSLKAMKTC